MSHWTDQEQAQIEFLRYLTETINPAYEEIILVLRGSLLLRHWFGAQARPAADLDFECFERVRGRRGRRFTSVTDHGRGLCAFATNQAWYHREEGQYLMFEENEQDTQGLWTYGTPGERFFADWAWQGAKSQRGRMQIDIAAAGAYETQDIGVGDITLAAIDGSPFPFPAYTAEAMLAAKLSWLVRGLVPHLDGGRVRHLSWKGQSKDLFDVHLLLTQADLNAVDFQRSLLAVGAEDKLDWLSVDYLFQTSRLGMTDADFADWPMFRAFYTHLDMTGPTEMLQTIAAHLEPLLGDLYRREEMPFLHAIQAERPDEANLLIYSDWLEEHGHDQRSAFLRLFARMQFRFNELSAAEQADAHAVLQTAWRETSIPWLHCLCGTSARFRELSQRIQTDTPKTLQPTQRPWWRFW